MKWRRWLLVGGLIVVGVVILSLINYRSEPRHNGRFLSEWLTGYGSTTNASQRNEAAEAVQHIGTNAIPYLIENFHTSPPRWMGKVYGFLLQRGPAPVRRWWYERCKRSAKGQGETGFAILGPAAVSAAPLLIPRLTGYKLDSGPERALLYMGESALPFLAAATTNHANTSRQRLAAILVIGRFGTNANGCVPTVRECLKEDPPVCEAAALTLGDIAVRPDEVIPALTNALQSQQVMLRGAIVKTFEKIGTDARSAAPALKECLNDTNVYVRIDATNALRRIAPEELGTANN